MVCLIQPVSVQCPLPTIEGNRLRNKGVGGVQERGRDVAGVGRCDVNTNT